MLAYLSHTRPFGWGAFSSVCVFSSDVKDVLLWCPKDRFLVVSSLNWIKMVSVSKRKIKKEPLKKHTCNCIKNTPQRFCSHPIRKSCVYFQTQLKVFYFKCFVYICLCRWWIRALQTWEAAVNKPKETRKSPGPFGDWWIRSLKCWAQSWSLSSVCFTELWECHWKLFSF